MTNKRHALALSVAALAVTVTTQSVAGAGAVKYAKNPALNGITMLPQAAVNQRYPIGDSLDPTVDAAVRALHPVSLNPDAVCGVRLPDGRQFILIQAETSNAEGSVPYVFAFDPGWTTKYLAQGDNSQAGAKAVYGNPDHVLRSAMASAVQGCANLRAELGLDPNGTDTGVAPAAPQPASTPDILGVPTDAQCAHPPAPASAQAQTQLAMNEDAGNRVIRDGCKARTAYLALQKRVGKDPAATTRLRAMQEAWVAYVDAHEKEFYSHEDDPSYYGSMFPMCVDGLDDAETVDRAKELKTEKACTAPDAAVSATEENALKTANAALATARANVRRLRAKERGFLKALERADAAWAKYGNAQVAFASGRETGGDQSSCGARERARVTEARTKALIELAKPKQDTCDAD